MVEDPDAVAELLDRLASEGDQAGSIRHQVAIGVAIAR